MEHVNALKALESLKKSAFENQNKLYSSLFTEEKYMSLPKSSFWNDSHISVAINWTIQNHHQINVQTFVRDVLIIAFYSLIILISILGNTLVFHVVYSKSKVRSITNVFIGNLAISDLFLGCLSAPFHVARILMDNWNLGKFLCVSISTVQSISVSVSTLTMACIAVDRYALISKPLKSRTKMFSARLKIASIWITALFFSTPYMIYTDVTEIMTFRKLERCAVIYPNPSDMYRKWITVTYLFILYVFPLGVAGIAYSKIIYILWYRKVLGTVTERQRLQHRKTKWKSIKMLMLVVIIFAVCWFPLNSYHLYNDYLNLSSPWKHKSTVFLFCHWFAMSSICYNPFIYCCFDETFKRTAKLYFSGVLKLFSFCKCHRITRLNSLRPKCETSITSRKCVNLNTYTFSSLISTKSSVKNHDTTKDENP